MQVWPNQNRFWRIKMKALSIFILTMVIFLNVTAAVEVAPRISDKEIIKTLTALKEGQKNILREMDKRFEAVDKRFEDINKRFKDINNRFEDINKRFGDINNRFENINKQLDQLVNIFIGIVAAFTGIVAVTIGFAIWDRKTAIAPVVRRLREIETENERIKNALKEISEKNPDFAEVLRHAGLL